MQIIENMLASTPNRKRGEAKTLADCVEVCLECEAACVTCADACRREPRIDMLRQCIALNLDCADLCAVTARFLARAREPGTPVIRSLLSTCMQACIECAVECRSHASMHEHCRVCAEACEACERICRETLESLSTTLT